MNHKMEEHNSTPEEQKNIEPEMEAPVAEKKKKKKKKKAYSLEEYDGRGVQTLFRTLSRNHYNLLRMVDNKASILLTINSFIVSALMGAAYIQQPGQGEFMEGKGAVLVNFCLVSMLFAVISMLPHRYFGARFAKSDYRGLLYAQNFSTMKLEDFMEEMRTVLKKGDELYDTMIKDLYFLGRSIAMKQGMVILSFIIFLIGMIYMAFVTRLNYGG